MKYYIILFLLLILQACKTEEDKYPELGYFVPTIEAEFDIEPLSSVASYYRDTENYVFFLNTKNTTPRELLVYGKKKRKLLKRLMMKSNIPTIDISGTIYEFDDASETAFKYAPPQFHKTALKTLSLDYLSTNTLFEKHKEYIKKNKLDENAEFSYIDKVRSERLQKDILADLISAVVLYNTYDMVLIYDETEVYVDSRFLYKGIFIKSKIKGIVERETADHNLLETDYFKSNHTKLFDQVTLDYSLEGSNHFVMGVSSSNLYYYDFDLNEKTMKFKSAYPINEIANFDDRIILKISNEYFNVSTKKEKK